MCEFTAPHHQYQDGMHKENLKGANKGMRHFCIHKCNVTGLRFNLKISHDPAVQKTLMYETTEHFAFVKIQPKYQKTIANPHDKCHI